MKNKIKQILIKYDHYHDQMEDELCELFQAHDKGIVEKIEKLNKYADMNWEIRFHSGLVDINFPDSPTPDYEDYTSLGKALRDVYKDIKTKNEK